MNKILVGLIVLVGLFNPLFGQYVQTNVLSVWDWLILNVGWIITIVFGVFVVFYMGVVFAKQSMKDRKTEAKNVAKASKSKKDNKAGMEYNAI